MICLLGESPEKRCNYLIDAIRHHFTQFNVWVGFFVAINVGLFAAFYNVSNNVCTNILLPLLGYVASF